MLGPIMASDSGSRESVGSERQFRIFPVSDKRGYCEFIVGEMERREATKGRLSPGDELIEPSENFVDSC